MPFIPVCEPVLLGNELKYITDAVETGWISSAGSYVNNFEISFAEYCGVKHAIAVCNGTVALHLITTALEIGKNDEVIIPDFTMIASALAVSYTGATPVFVDANPQTWNIAVTKIEEKITSKTKAIMAVHIFGQPCDMTPIHNLAKKYNLYVIEDAAQAHGAVYQGKKAGNLSDIAAFSFFANKNLTTGEGGMVVTNNDKLASACRYYKNMCFPLDSPRTYLHQDIGFNYRMSNLHAAIGLAQVEKADDYKQMRVQNGLIYRNLLSQIKGIDLQQDIENSEPVFWMNGICLNEEYGRTRTELITHLQEKDIDTRLFFSGMHKQQCLLKAGVDSSGAYPVSNNLSKNGFYLPSGSGLSQVDIEYICNIIKNFRK